MDTWYAKAAIAGAVTTLHAAVLSTILQAKPDGASSDVDASGGLFATAEIIQPQNSADTLPLPDLQVVRPKIDLTTLQAIRFDDSIEDELRAVIGPTSTPRLARVQSVDSESFAKRAHLSPGRAVTVVLRVEITEDGLADSADVVRPSHDAAADAAAINYAMELRWIPGTVDHKPRTMRVILPVTLAIPVTAVRSALCPSARARRFKTKCAS